MNIRLRADLDDDRAQNGQPLRTVVPPTRVFVLVGYSNSIRNDHVRSLQVIRP